MKFLFEKSIEFKNVSFKYDKVKNDVINKLNFTINKNEKVAIIGKTVWANPLW